MEQRQPPRFVPTLTEVIEPELDAAWPGTAAIDPQPALAAAQAPVAEAATAVLLDEPLPVHEAVEVVPTTVPVAQMPPISADEDAASDLPVVATAPEAQVQAQPLSPVPAAAVDMEALVQAAVMAQLPMVMAQLQPVVEDAIRTAVLRSLGHIGSTP